MTPYPDDVVEKALNAFFDAVDWRTVVMPADHDREMRDMRHALAAAEAAMWRPDSKDAPINADALVQMLDVDGSPGYVTKAYRTRVEYKPGVFTDEWWGRDGIVFDDSSVIRWRPLPTPPAASTGRG